MDGLKKIMVELVRVGEFYCWKNPLKDHSFYRRKRNQTTKIRCEPGVTIGV
jgi:hypothetical protein